MLSNRFPVGQPFRGVAAFCAVVSPSVAGRRSAWLPGILGVVALALAAIGDLLLLLPAEPAQAQDGSRPSITAGAASPVAACPRWCGAKAARRPVGGGGCRKS